MSPPAHVSFRPGAVLEDLRARGPRPGVVARLDLTRYYAILKQALAEITLTPAEARLIAQAVEHVLAGGTPWDTLPSHWQWVPACLVEALHHGGTPGRAAPRLDTTGVAVDDLLELVRALDSTAMRALVDALERYRFALESEPDSDKLLDRIGLT